MDIPLHHLLYVIVLHLNMILPVILCTLRAAPALCRAFADRVVYFVNFGLTRRWTLFGLLERVFNLVIRKLQNNQELENALYEIQHAEIWGKLKDFINEANNY